MYNPWMTNVRGRSPKDFMKTNLRFLLPFLFTLPFAHAQEMKSGEDVLRAMHDRYAKTWYQTLTFTQKSTTFNPDGTSSVATWYEALDAPAKLRIDVGEPAKNTGYLMVDQTATMFRDGTQTGSRPLVNMLLVLGFDVYRQDPAATAKVAKDEGYDTSKVHEETWQGEPFYVVGADSGDTKSKQFWIEKKRLLFLRLLEPMQSNPDKVQDVRFTDYREMAGGWVAARVEVYVNGQKTFTEEYSDIQANVKLPAGVFDPKQFTTTHWEKP